MRYKFLGEGIPVCNLELWHSRSRGIFWGYAPLCTGYHLVFSHFGRTGCPHCCNMTWRERLERQQRDHPKAHTKGSGGIYGINA
ncbi:MAG: hypothetical protein ACLR23_17195 [Clostridia bacterium]